MTTPATGTGYEYLFAIDDVWLYPPDGYQEEPVPVVGYTLAGTPIRQGYKILTFTWSFMKQQNVTNLLACFTPDTPRKTIAYIDARTGRMIKAWGMMHEPVIGARQVVFYNNIAVKFSHLVQITAWTKGYTPCYTNPKGTNADNTYPLLPPRLPVTRLTDQPADFVKVQVPNLGVRYLPSKNLTVEPPDTENSLLSLGETRYLTASVVYGSKRLYAGTRVYLNGTLYYHPYLDANLAVAGAPLQEPPTGVVYPELGYITDTQYTTGSTAVTCTLDSGASRTVTLRPNTQITVSERPATGDVLVIDHPYLIGLGTASAYALTPNQPATIQDDTVYTTAWTTSQVTVVRSPGGTSVGTLYANTAVEVLERGTDGWTLIRHFALDGGQGYVPDGGTGQLTWTAPLTPYNDQLYWASKLA